MRTDRNILPTPKLTFNGKYMSHVDFDTQGTYIFRKKWVLAKYFC